MRDPNRCFSVITQVGVIWQSKFPDMRFMQLMSNFAMWLGRDPFYMEDDEFIDKFNQFAKEFD